MLDLKKCFVARNKLPMVVLVVFYAALLYILNFVLIQNDIKILHGAKDKIIIQLEKK